jgi:hypothetical protein
MQRGKGRGRRSHRFTNAPPCRCRCRCRCRALLTYLPAYLPIYAGQELLVTAAASQLVLLVKEREDATGKLAECKHNVNTPVSPINYIAIELLATCYYVKAQKTH